MVTREQVERISMVQEEIDSARRELEEVRGTPLEAEAKRFLADREKYLQELLYERIHHTAAAVVKACFPML